MKVRYRRLTNAESTDFGNECLKEVVDGLPVRPVGPEYDSATLEIFDGGLEEARWVAAVSPLNVDPR
jgi:hypothetical protein